MTEGALYLFDGMHPRLVRQRLHSFLNAAAAHDLLPEVWNLRSKPDRYEAEISANRNQSTRRWMVSYVDVLTILLAFFLVGAARI